MRFSRSLTFSGTINVNTPIGPMAITVVYCPVLPSNAYNFALYINAINNVQIRWCISEYSSMQKHMQ